MRVTTLVAVALSLGTLACLRDEDDIAVDTLAGAPDTTVAFAAGETAPPRDSGLRERAKPAAEPATADGKALGAFVAASRHEIQHGQLATQKGSTQMVRDFGRSDLRDHDDFVQRGRELGRRLSIALTPQPNDTTFHGHPSAMGDLRVKRGADFDRAFLGHEVEYHRWLIDAVNRTMLPQATKEDLRTFLQQSIAAFEAHLKGAQDLLAKVGRP
jgi:putative membrane protein